MIPVTFGMQSDGSYLTPYNLTVLYAPTDRFAATIAHLCSDLQTQLVDTDHLADALLSPKLCVLSKLTEPTTEILGGMKFQQVYFYDQNARGESGDDVSSDHGSSEPRSNTFGPDQLLTILQLSSYNAVIASEYLLTANIPEYKSMFADVTHARAKYLMTELKSMSADALGNICLRANGHEHIEQLVLRGQMRAQFIQDQVADEIAHGIVFKLEIGRDQHVDAIAIQTSHTKKCIRALAGGPMGVHDYAVLYSCSQSVVPGDGRQLWHVVIVSRTDVQAEQILGTPNHEANVEAMDDWTRTLKANGARTLPMSLGYIRIGPYSCAHAFVPSELMWNILPFMC